jgi:hypothetical protein
MPVCRIDSAIGRPASAPSSNWASGPNLEATGADQEIGAPKHRGSEAGGGAGPTTASRNLQRRGLAGV